MENFPKSNTRCKGGHQKVLVCSSLVKSVHNSCLYLLLCVFLVAQTRESKIAFSINKKLAVIVALSARMSFLFRVAFVTGFTNASVMKCQKKKVQTNAVKDGKQTQTQ